MSERIPFTPEQSSESLANDPEHLIQTAEQNHETEAQLHKAAEKAAEAARAEISEQAAETDPMAKIEEQEAQAAETARPSHVNSELKSITLRRELQQIRRKLPAGDRALSKVVHQPVVRVVSEAASASISRPSGLLGGGLMAFVGSLGYLYITKHVGMQYNYFVFTLLFILGFAVGLVLELLVWGLTSRHRHAAD